MKKTPIKMLLAKTAMYTLAVFISFFSIIASAVIFRRSIEIVQNLDYTKGEEYAILISVGFVLAWLCSLAASSAESIVTNQILKTSKEKK
jgi:hypothetical protein